MHINVLMFFISQRREKTQMVTENLKGRRKKRKKRRSVTQEKGRKRGGKASPCDVVEGRKRGKTLRKCRRRKKRELWGEQVRYRWERVGKAGKAEKVASEMYTHH